MVAVATKIFVQGLTEPNQTTKDLNDESVEAYEERLNKFRSMPGIEVIKSNYFCMPSNHLVTVYQFTQTLRSSGDRLPEKA